jgi:hypothetical protein
MGKNMQSDMPENHQQARDYALLCDTLKRMRDEAVTGRITSGIEEIWIEDQEHYDGVDDSNRTERATKPRTSAGTVRLSNTEKPANTRSTVFVEITRPYVDAAAARVSDMLLPTDDRNWALTHTPMPDMVVKLEDATPLADPAGRQVVMPEDGRPATVADQARQVIEAARKAAEKAQTRIDDWLTECNYLDECRSVIDDAARIGTGILKGPHPMKKRKRAVVNALQKVGIVIQEAIVPWSCRVDPWNFFPDPDCGEDIQRGKYCFERDYMTGKQLGDLRGTGYLDEVLNQILEEGPGGHKDDNNPNEKNRSDSELYEVWYFHGYLSARDLDMMGTSHGSGEQFPVIATIINDKVAKVALSVLDSGEYPYDIFVWQRRPGHWAGKGVSRQMRTEQRGVNAATRALMDNMGESSRPYRIINRALIEPGPDRWTWYAKEDADVQNVRDAVTFFAAPSMQAELAAVIDYWMKRAEDATGLPMLLQGQLGRAPDTVGGMTMLNNNASTVLRRIAKNYDSRITERHIGRYYEWLLIYGEDDSEKGDFSIKARGSSALIERDMQNQVLIQSIGMSLNPAFGLSPQKMMQKFLKGQRLAVEELELDDEEKQKLAQMQQQPQDPRLQVAQLNAQVQGQKVQSEERIEAMRIEAEQRDAELDRAFAQWEKNIDATLEAARIDNEKSMNFDEIKASLADTAMKLRTQVKLAGRKQVLTPPTEPPQHAPDGMAYQQ